MSRTLHLGSCLIASLCACAHVSSGAADSALAAPAQTGRSETPRSEAAAQSSPAAQNEVGPERIHAASPRHEPSTAASPAPDSRTCVLPALSEASSAELIAQRGTQLERYQLEGGTWLAPAPVLVNQDFDFATALGMGPVGAGLAAGKRLEANRQKAAALTPVSLPAEVVACLDELRAAGLHAYFVLWGSDNATLRLVIDAALECGGQSTAQVTQGPEHAQAAWTEEGRLMREAAQLLAKAPQTASFARCRTSPP